MSFIQNSQATANKAEYGMKDKKDELWWSEKMK